MDARAGRTGAAVSAATDLVFDGAMRLQVDRWLRHRLRDEVVILTYHGFAAEPQRSGVRNFHGKHVAAAALRAQLAYLKRHHTILSLGDLVRGLTGERALPARPVVVTIDDGYRSTYTVAFPVLRDLGVPAAVFVATDFVGRRRPLWPDRVEYALATTRASRLHVRVGDRPWTLDTSTVGARIASCRTLYDQLSRLDDAGAAAGVESVEREAATAVDMDDEMFAPLTWSDLVEMRRSGLVEIGSHSVSHPLLTRCGAERQRAEITASKAEIETMTGAACDVFCYPSGQPGDFDETTRRLVREAGYRAALTTIPGTNVAGTDPLALRRFTITDTEPFATFVMKIYGLVNAASRVTTAVRSALSGRAHG